MRIRWRITAPGLSDTTARYVELLDEDLEGLSQSEVRLHVSEAVFSAMCRDTGYTYEFPGDATNTEESK